MARAVVDEYDWERLEEESAENAVTRDMFLGLLWIKDFPDKKAEQERILVMATLTLPRPDRRIPFDLQRNILFRWFTVQGND